MPDVWGFRVSSTLPVTPFLPAFLRGTFLCWGDVDLFYPSKVRCRSLFTDIIRYNAALLLQTGLLSVRAPVALTDHVCPIESYSSVYQQQLLA